MKGHSPQPKAATNTKQAQNNLDYITLPKPCQTPNKQLTKQPARKKASLVSAPVYILCAHNVDSKFVM